MIYKNEHFNLYTKEEKDICIWVNQLGYDIKDFSKEVLDKFPQIQMTNFLGLKEALNGKIGEEIVIGIIKPKIQVFLASDKMEAKIKINVTEAQFSEMKNELATEIIQALEEKAISYGILHNVLKEELEPQKEIVIARGTLPIKGNDAEIKYIDMAEKRPTIKEDGKIDYYEMNLINQVRKNDWVGEKLLATEGKPGKTVTNEELAPMAGKDDLLRYDNKTITTSRENNKVILRALVDGAVTFEEGKIKILNHLIINGDIDYDTGNINFNGYVTIHGIVCDGFSVIADKDISIQGLIGIGAAKEIISKDGDIYIKGGISGKGKTVIKAKKNIFVKYANDCTIIAGGDINIGLYAIDADLHGKNITVNSKKGKIIGGSLNAKAKVNVYTIGNISEKKTFVNVKGFNRQSIKEELDALLLRYKKCLIALEESKRQMKIYEIELKMDYKKVLEEEYKAYSEVNDKLLAEISRLEKERKNLTDFLESKGEGEVNIFKEAYPQTFLEIKNIQKRIDKLTTGSYYAVNNNLHYS